jgi:hypothetical protein
MILAEPISEANIATWSKQPKAKHSDSVSQGTAMSPLSSVMRSITQPISFVLSLVKQLPQPHFMFTQCCCPTLFVRRLAPQRRQDLLLACGMTGWWTCNFLGSQL